MSDKNDIMELYTTGLRNQHAVENQAIETIEAQLSRMEPYADLHSRMKQEISQSRTQASRLESMLSKRGTSASSAKEAVTSIVGKVSGVVHISADDEVVKNVLSAIGFKAYEIASYKALIVLAEAAGANEDASVLKQSMEEEQELGDWLGEHLPGFVKAFLQQHKAS